MTTDSNPAELEKCPRCGHNDALLRKFPDMNYVTCLGCNFVAPGCESLTTVEEATSTWNAYAICQRLANTK